MIRQSSLLSRMVRQGALALVGLGVFLAVLGGRLYLRNEYGSAGDNARGGAPATEGAERWLNLPPLFADCADSAAIALNAILLLLTFLCFHSARNGLLLVAASLGAFLGPFVWAGVSEPPALAQHLLTLLATACLAGVCFRERNHFIVWPCVALALFIALISPAGSTLPATLGLLAAVQTWSKGRLDRRGFILGMAGLLGTVLGISIHSPSWSGARFLQGLSSGFGSVQLTHWAGLALWLPTAAWLVVVLMRRLAPTAHGWYFGFLATWVALNLACSGTSLRAELPMDRELAMIGWLTNLLLLLTWGDPLERSLFRRWRRGLAALWFVLFAFCVVQQVEARHPITPPLLSGPPSHSAPPSSSAPSREVYSREKHRTEDGVTSLVTQITEGSLQILWIGAGLAFASAFVLLFWPEPRPPTSSALP